MVTACTRLLRGSWYVGFDGEIPPDPQHAALTSEYAHVTAPLRRLGDRYSAEISLALCAGTDMPGWVLDQLPKLLEILHRSAARAHQYENAILDLVEAGILQGRVGESFPAVVVDVDEKDDTRGDITIQGRPWKAACVALPRCRSARTCRYASSGRPRHPQGGVHARVASEPPPSSAMLATSRPPSGRSGSGLRRFGPRTRAWSEERVSLLAQMPTTPGLTSGALWTHRGSTR